MSKSHAGHDHGSEGNLRLAFFLNFAFTILEIAGGLWTNSIAIQTDALHDAGDSASLGLAWYFERMSERGRSAKHTYGYTRYRLLGGLITGLILVAGLAYMLWSAIGRVMNPEPVNAPGMMALAVVGVLVNGAAVWRVKKGSSLTEQVVSWHLLEDALGWIAVLIGAGVMAVWDLPIIDPILSILISVFVLLNVGRNLNRVMKVFLQTAPESFDAGEFERKLAALPKVSSVHHLHIWSLDGERHVLSVHLVMESDSKREDISLVKGRVRSMLDEREFEDVALDVELEGEQCVASEEE